MFLSLESHFEFLSGALSKNPNKIFISSFGIYAGITATGQDTTTWGPKYRSFTREFLEAIRKIDKVYLLVGIAPYRSCKGDGKCKYCETKYLQNLLRLAYHEEIFPEFQWRISTELHLKCSLFFYNKRSPIGVAGGRNLTDSDWEDLTFEIDKGNISKLFNHLMGVWGSSRRLTDETIGNIIKEQGISESVVTEIGSL